MGCRRREVTGIIGEAARKVSMAFQEEHPEIPWRPIMEQRHVLAHEYGEIQQDRVWRVAATRVPAPSWRRSPPSFPRFHWPGMPRDDSVGDGPPKG
jgi:hypothetical protein